MTTVGVIFLALVLSSIVLMTMLLLDNRRKRLRAQEDLRRSHRERVAEIYRRHHREEEDIYGVRTVTTTNQEREMHQEMAARRRMSVEHEVFNKIYHSHYEPNVNEMYGGPRRRIRAIWDAKKAEYMRHMKKIGADHQRLELVSNMVIEELQRLGIEYELCERPNENATLSFGFMVSYSGLMGDSDPDYMKWLKQMAKMVAYDIKAAREMEMPGLPTTDKQGVQVIVHQFISQYNMDTGNWAPTLRFRTKYWFQKGI